MVSILKNSEITKKNILEVKDEIDKIQCILRFVDKTRFLDGLLGH